MFAQGLTSCEMYSRLTKRRGAVIVGGILTGPPHNINYATTTDTVAYEETELWRTPHNNFWRCPRNSSTIFSPRVRQAIFLMAKRMGLRLSLRTRRFLLRLLR